MGTLRVVATEKHTYAPTQAGADSAAELYLDLLKRTLLNEIYSQGEFFLRKPEGALRNALFRFLARPDEMLARPRDIRQRDRETGGIWPPSPLAHTMIGRRRLDNLAECISAIITDNIPGDLIETGVWRGGASIFMKGCLKAFGDTKRAVWVADSFHGLPPPDAELHPLDAGDVHHTYPELAISASEVRENFGRYGLLDARVCFLEGWFSDTLPKAPIDRLAVIRLDGDMYGSTMDALRALYSKLSSGGFVIVDDYCLKPCAQAVSDFRAAVGSTEPMETIDTSSVFWRKAAE